MLLVIIQEFAGILQWLSDWSHSFVYSNNFTYSKENLTTEKVLSSLYISLHKANNLLLVWLNTYSLIIISSDTIIAEKVPTIITIELQYYKHFRSSFVVLC